MPLLRPTRDDQCRVEEVSSLFVAGAMLLHEMLSRNDQVSFDAWAYRFYEGTSQSEGIATRELPMQSQSRHQSRKTPATIENRRFRPTFSSVSA